MRACGSSAWGERLSAILARPVVAQNDVKAAAFAEAAQGGPTGENGLLFLEAGEGCGAAFVAQGQVLEGRLGLPAKSGRRGLRRPRSGLREARKEAATRRWRACSGCRPWRPRQLRVPGPKALSMELHAMRKSMRNWFFRLRQGETDLRLRSSTTMLAPWAVCFTGWFSRFRPTGS
ncbi:MAG: ROK family protein [Candidatus Competibacteraceae bacterium]|nr:ROK family protein [Candidatus Competibacteraceae bacterium]